jgi:hypothetical protein
MRSSFPGHQQVFIHCKARSRYQQIECCDKNNPRQIEIVQVLPASKSNSQPNNNCSAILMLAEEEAVRVMACVLEAWRPVGTPWPSVEASWSLLA